MLIAKAMRKSECCNSERFAKEMPLNAQGSLKVWYILVFLLLSKKGFHNFHSRLKEQRASVYVKSLLWVEPGFSVILLCDT